MPSRPRLLWIPLLLIGLLAASACTPEKRPVRNVILISIDTLRADRLGAYGHDAPTSPTLDALAASGVLFEDVMSTAPWTLPAHASLLTGLYPTRHGTRTNRHRLSDEVPTLTSTLAEAGYDTAAFVQGFFMEKYHGLTGGFDHYEVYEEDQTPEGSTTRVLADVTSWLQEHGERPVFLFVHLFDVHSDYRSLPRYEQQFAPEPGRLDGNAVQIMMALTGLIPPIDAADVEHLTGLYDAGIRQLDDRLGVFFAWLEEHGWRDDTLIVVTADHGEAFNEHGDMIHGRSHYQEELRIPLIFQGPGVPAGVRVATPVSLVDTFPTMLGQLGVAIPKDIDGRDLSALWSGDEEVLGDRFLISETGPSADDNLRTIRKGRFKLIFDRSSDSRQLYDLEADPGETRDLAASHPEKVAELSAALERATSSPRAPVFKQKRSRKMEERLRALGYIRPGD